MKKLGINLVSFNYNFWLDKWNDFRSANWLDILEFPEITLKSTQQLLAVSFPHPVWNRFAHTVIQELDALFLQAFFGNLLDQK